MPVPMMPPIPSAVRAVAERTRLSFGPLESSACRSEIDLVAKSWLAIKLKPPKNLWPDSGGTSAFAQLLWHVRVQQLDQRCVDFGRTRQYVPSLCVFATRERTNASASFLNQQRSGRGIPRCQANLPEPISSSRCDISQVERCRTGTTNTSGVLH